MHEKERHAIILNAIQTRPILTIAEICDLTNASEATARRDVTMLHDQKKLKRLRGGVEALQPPQPELAGRPFSFNETIQTAEKDAIARRAAELCKDGDSVILSGGTTVFHMVHSISQRRMQVLTNSFPVAQHLIGHSQNTVTLCGGTVYRGQNIILSPYKDSVTDNFVASTAFIGAHGIGYQGIMEADPLIIQSALALVKQAREVVVLADSSKFDNHHSMILCGIQNVSKLITDDRIRDADAAMIESNGVELITVHVPTST